MIRVELMGVFDTDDANGIVFVDRNRRPFPVAWNEFEDFEEAEAFIQWVASEDKESAWTDADAIQALVLQWGKIAYQCDDCNGFSTLPAVNGSCPACVADKGEPA